MPQLSPRSTHFLCALLLIAWLGFAVEVRSEEYRKWTPKGQEPFYGKMIGYSPDKGEAVIDKHGENGKSVRVPIALMTGEDTKVIKAFIARSKSPPPVDFSGPSVEDRGNDRWNLNPLISIGLPSRAAGWRLTSKSPLVFTAVDVEDNKKSVLTVYVAAPVADDKAFEKHWATLFASVKKQLGKEGLKEVPAKLELKEAETSSVNRLITDRMYVASASDEAATLKIHVFRGEDATIAFVARGSEGEVTEALKCLNGLTYQPNALHYFRASGKKR